MRFRELFGGDLTGGGPLQGDSGGGELSRLRRQGEDFLAAGDEAIDRALSGNSEAFITANRQHGGQ